MRFVLLAALVLLGCSHQQASRPVVFQGQRMAVVGSVVSPGLGEMVPMGQAADGRTVYMRRGGGGGVGTQPLFVAVSPGAFQEIVPLPIVGR